MCLSMFHDHGSKEVSETGCPVHTMLAEPVFSKQSGAVMCMLGVSRQFRSA